MKPKIFHSDLSGRYYYCTRYKDLGGGNFEASRKVDVTDDVNAIVEKELSKERLKIAKLRSNNLPY